MFKYRLMSQGGLDHRHDADGERVRQAMLDFRVHSRNHGLDRAKPVARRVVIDGLKPFRGLATG
jgi:hypothetical protein